MIIQEFETLLRQRKHGWWSCLVQQIPELYPLANTQQPLEYHAEGDVATHTRKAIEACPDDCDPDLLWAALLHDIGKPATTKDIDGKIIAHGHDRIGAVIAEEVLTRLGMQTQRKARIAWTIKHHLFYHSWQIKNIQDVTKRHLALIRNPDFPLLLELIRIDSIASEGRPSKLAYYEFYRKLLLSVIMEQNHGYSRNLE